MLSLLDSLEVRLIIEISRPKHIEAWSHEDDPLSFSSVAFHPARLRQTFIGAETMLLPQRRSRKERHTMYFSGHWTRCSVTLLRVRRRLFARWDVWVKHT
jgi:hypothetical protein